MAMPTPLKPFGKKLRLKLERLQQAAEGGLASGARIEDALWGKKMKRKLARLAAEAAAPAVRTRPAVGETVGRILDRQARNRVGPATRAAEQTPFVTEQRRKTASKRAGKGK